MSELAQRSLFPQIEDPEEHEIRARWRHLVGDRLPRAALERNWSITANHCFARILLDVTLRRPWRNAVSAPAWRHTPINQLEQAIALGEALLDRSQRNLLEAALQSPRLVNGHCAATHLRSLGGLRLGDADAARSQKARSLSVMSSSKTTPDLRSSSIFRFKRSLG